MKATYTLTLLAILGLMSCGGDGDEGDGNVLPDGNAPSATTLVFPEDNTECTEITIISTTESSIRFQWNRVDDADSYELNIRNLETNAILKGTTEAIEASVTLQRGLGYEWFVTTQKEGSEAVGSSAKWKFYNPGDGVQHYAPFAAEAVSPTRGQLLETSGTITLRWQAADVDNDIVGYEVFFGTDSNPRSTLGNAAQNTISANVIAGQTYYWRVKTTDATGNSSNSEVFDFRVR